MYLFCDQCFAQVIGGHPGEAGSSLTKQLPAASARTEERVFHTHYLYLVSSMLLKINTHNMLFHECCMTFIEHNGTIVRDLKHALSSTFACFGDDTFPPF